MPMPWPKTRVGKTVLWITVFYVAMWLSFVGFPDFKTFVLALPYIGVALQVFFALYVAGVLIWLVWMFLF